MEMQLHLIEGKTLRNTRNRAFRLNPVAARVGRIGSRQLQSDFVIAGHKVRPLANAPNDQSIQSRSS